MKIQLCAALLIAALLSLLSGCTAAAVTALDAAGDAAEQHLDAAQDAAESAVARIIDPAPATQLPAALETLPPAATPPAATASARLTPEEAKSAALQHAGFTAEQVAYLRCELDTDDRVLHYDVEFCKDRWEYEYEIHGETGAVLSFEKDD